MSNNENPVTSFLDQTNSLGVVTGQPIAQTSTATSSTSQVSSTAPASSSPPSSTSNSRASTSTSSSASSRGIPTPPRNTISTSPTGPTPPSDPPSETLTVSSSPSSTLSESGEGLSQAAKVGIGLGVPLGAIVIAFLIWFMFFRTFKISRREPPIRRKKSARTAFEIEDTEKNGQRQMMEVDGGGETPHERELEGSKAERRHELPGGERGLHGREDC